MDDLVERAQYLRQRVQRHNTAVAVMQNKRSEYIEKLDGMGLTEETAPEYLEELRNTLGIKMLELERAFKSIEEILDEHS